MKEATCSKNSRCCLTAKNLEDRLIRKIDRRVENGKANEDECSEHMIVNKDGSRSWSF